MLVIDPRRTIDKQAAGYLKLWGWVEGELINLEAVTLRLQLLQSQVESHQPHSVFQGISDLAFAIIGKLYLIP